jgi:Zn-dependent peptidase ImmA (M78 family)
MNPQKQQKIHQKVIQLLQENRCTEAPVDVEAIAASLNIEIRKTPAEDDLSGFLLKQGVGSVVIGVNSLHHPNRQRFTIGHEIGHFMLHNHEQVHVDRFVLKLRNVKSSTGENPEEIEANSFAAALLMPFKFLERDLPQFATNGLLDERGLARLANRYRVSKQAMTNRLISLGFISDSASLQSLI